MKMKSGMNGDSNLSQSEDSHRTTTLTDNKKRDYEKKIFNAWWLIHWHQPRSRSHVLQVFQVTSQVSPFYYVVLYVVHVWIFHWILWAPPWIAPLPPTGGRTRWLVPILILPEWHWPWVVVHQILGVDGVMWTTRRWTQNDSSMVQMFWNYWEKSTNSFCIESILLASYDGWILFALVHPSWHRSLHLDHGRVEMHEIQDRSQNDGGSLENASWCISFSNYVQ